MLQAQTGQYPKVIAIDLDSAVYCARVTGKHWKRLKEQGTGVNGDKVEKIHLWELRGYCEHEQASRQHPAQVSSLQCRESWRHPLMSVVWAFQWGGFSDFKKAGRWLTDGFALQAPIACRQETIIPRSLPSSRLRRKVSIL